MRKVMALVLVPLVFAATACGGDDLPYTEKQMSDAQIDCSTDHSVFGTDEMQCLRDDLPKLSDEQLERIDSLIDGSAS